MKMAAAALCFLTLSGFTVSFVMHAQQQSAALTDGYVKAHYTKYEFRIPMRDGARLFTSVYVPKDPSQRWPILMDRTPYSVAPYGEDKYKAKLGPSDEFEKAGYIFVYQDVRGRYLSEGEIRRDASAHRSQVRA